MSQASPTTPSRGPQRTLLLSLLACAGALVGCGPEPDLVIYVALDQVFSEELVNDFEAETGLNVRAEYDLEAQKTVGLVGRIIEEAKGGTRCDVFWNNEIAQTVHLEHLGLLQPYDSPSAADIPAEFRDPEFLWTGFAARARVLIVNTNLVQDPGKIRGMWDLHDPAWHGVCTVARPLTGTTLTHAAAMYETFGMEEADRYWRFIAEHQSESPPAVNVARSNGQVMTLVADGQLAWGWTDTDDFNVARLNGKPVMPIYPDQMEGPNGEPPMGTLLIPNTVCMIQDAPHPDNAKRFIDWVLRKEIEERLAHSRSAQIPVRASVDRPPHVRDNIHILKVDYDAVGRNMAAHTDHLRKMFLGE